MKNLYVISGVTGMTGNELARQLLNDGHTVIGFDNFFASSIDAVQDIVNNKNFLFYEYDLNNVEQMSDMPILISIVLLRKFIPCNPGMNAVE